MYKKIIFTGLFSMMSTATFAATQVSLKQDNSTYVTTGTTYVGGSAGFPTSPGNAYSGDIFAGYGKKFGATQRFYLGGEATAEVDYFRSDFLSHSSTAYSLGASVIPGLMLTPTLMAYGRIGLKNYFYSHANYIGTVLGVGLQKDINKNWGVRGEYLLSSSLANRGQTTLGVVYKFD